MCTQTRAIVYFWLSCFQILLGLRCLNTFACLISLEVKYISEPNSAWSSLSLILPCLLHLAHGPLCCSWICNTNPQRNVSLVQCNMRDRESGWLHNSTALSFSISSGLCFILFISFLSLPLVHALRKKATIHQVTTMLATSKNVPFPGHNHLLTTGTDISLALGQ